MTSPDFTSPLSACTAATALSTHALLIRNDAVLRQKREWRCCAKHPWRWGQGALWPSTHRLASFLSVLSAFFQLSLNSWGSVTAVASYWRTQLAQAKRWHMTKQPLGLCEVPCIDGHEIACVKPLTSASLPRLKRDQGVEAHTYHPNRRSSTMIGKALPEIGLANAWLACPRRVSSPMWPTALYDHVTPRW
jgi:hypothetical protein